MKTAHTYSVSVYAIAIALAVTVGGSAFWYVTRPPVGDDPVFSRKVLDYREVSAQEEVATIQYSFVGERLPERLERNEIPELRTASSYVLEVAEPRKDKRTFEGRFFPQEVFVRENGEWYYKEIATTTMTAFNATRKQNPFASLFAPWAYAANIFSTAGDGYISSDSSGPIDWDTAHDGITGTAGSLATDARVATGYLQAFTIYFMFRAFLTFDTSSIPAGATISSATLNAYFHSKTNDLNDGLDYITIVRTSQSTHTTLANTDYDQCGAIDSPTEGIATGQRKDLTSLSTGAYTSFTLNATGLGWISKSGQASVCSGTAGITCLGMREGHDTTDTSVGEIVERNEGIWYTSERAGTSEDPYLSVIYSVPTAFWQWADF